MSSLNRYRRNLLRFFTYSRYLEALKPPYKGVAATIIGVSDCGKNCTGRLVSLLCIELRLNTAVCSDHFAPNEVTRLPCRTNM